MNKKPFIHVVKRKELPRSKTIILRIVAFVLALMAGGLFMLFIGCNPMEVYGTILMGCFRSTMAIQATVKILIPLVIAALGVSLAFKMRFWNIGAEGQIIMGGIFASYFALYHPNWPHFILLLVMFIAGALGGALWAYIPTFCKVRFNTNETLFTLMLNYIALYIICFLRDGPWADPNSPGFAKIPTFFDNATLDTVLGVHSGWIIAIILVVLVYIYMNYTKEGYELSVVGGSSATAAYAGMNVKKIMIRTMLLSGGICGIGGMIQATGADATLSVGVAGGVGFTAIIIAWMAQLDPRVIVVISALFAILEKGSRVVESNMGISADSSAVLQGIILFFIMGCEFFFRYSFRFREKAEEKPDNNTEEVA